MGGIQTSAAQPIRVHPENPYIFEFRGQPTLLRTFGPHYGWVFDSSLSAIPHLDVFQRDGMNLTRIWCIGYPADSPEHFIQPWARSTTGTNGLDGQKKWDLNTWDEAYFTRLKNFVQAAGERGIVVELTFFSVFYNNTEWLRSSLHPGNNVQGYGSATNYYDCFRQNSANAQLLERQLAAVRRIVREVNEFDNVYFEIHNEPWWNETGIKDAEEVAFHSAMLAAIRDEESQLPNKHLVAHNYPQQMTAMSADFDILNEHYPAPVPGSPIAGAEALLSNHYSRGKILSLDETDTLTAAQARLEAWMFLIGGGAVYNGLDFAGLVYYTPGFPGGDTPLGNSVRQGIRNIGTFMDRTNLVALRRDLTWVTGGKPTGATLQASSSPGQQYIAYLHHGQSGNQNFQLRYDPIDSSNHSVSLNVALPAGTWRAVWTRPSDLEEVKIEEFTHGGGTRTLEPVTYQADIALRIDRTGVGDATPPPTPTGLSAVATPDGRITLSWNSVPSFDVAAYHVYRSDSPGVTINPASRIAVVQPETTSFADQLTMNGITYYYAVTAVDLSLNEGAAAETSATSIVPDPEIHISTNESGQVVVSWPSTAVGWYLQESPDSSPGSWVYSPLVPVLVGNQFQVTFTPAGQGRNFRLISQAPPPPVLAVSRGAGNQILLTWTRASVGWNLQQSVDLSEGSWQNVTLTPAVVGDNYQLTLSATTPCCFFRFILP
jgi:hypothetical protein